MQGIDYRNTPVVVTFEAGSKFSSYASILIASDDIPELDETFKATFELPDGYRNLNKTDPKDVEITIEDKNQGLYAIGRCVTIYKYVERIEMETLPQPSAKLTK